MLENVASFERGSNEFSLGQGFLIVCVSCGVKIREKASEDSYGLCLKCFYTDLAKRLSGQPRARPGEFVSER
jgi:hypothetical protein